MTDKSNSEKRYWLDSKKNVGKVYWSVWVICGALLVIDPFIHKHGEFQIESWFGFYGFYGLVACVGLVLVAKLLRKVLIRPEDYYER